MNRRRGPTLGPLCLLVLLVVGGCGSVGVATDTSKRMEYEGYTAVYVQLEAGEQADVVTIRTRGNPKLSDEEAVESLQTTMWNSLPRRFDTLDIRVGREHRETSYQQLLQRFGPRDGALDERQIGIDVSTVLITVSIVAGLVMALLGILAITLSRRRKWEQEQSGSFELHYPPTAG